MTDFSYHLVLLFPKLLIYLTFQSFYFDDGYSRNVSCGSYIWYLRFYSMLQRKSSAGTTGATSGTGSENTSEAPAFSPSFSVIRVVQSSVSCSVCCRSLSCFLDLRFLSDYLFGIFKLSLTFVLEINNEERLKTKFYNKRDDFTFPLINLPFFSSTIFQQHYQMGIIPHNSYVIQGLATSTAIFCTELFWWW